MSVVETEVWCTCSSPDALYSVYMCTSAGASLLSSPLSSPPGPSARPGMGASLVGSSPPGPSARPGTGALLLGSSPPGPSARTGMGASLVGSSPPGPSDDPGMRALCSVEKCVHVMDRMPATKLF